jgi:hypothetical protein
MRIIILTFREAEFLWWCSDIEEKPARVIPIFREVMSERLGAAFNAKVIVKFADKFNISDTALEEYYIEQYLNDVFFWLEETNGWLSPSGPLVG